ncbi:hypothetical protein [Flavobacterium celericrescens]|uniref:Uncharacterized protein n=1 Tax=Flavobacterium celericrescens TaxID=2709780 RepID=A0ABX0ICR7_9FLAO|nr:hypothetical protein [Flavobacterium celericrescens]NHM03659.1 hypothetical protein [Flavobacterium celericrescens]
MTNETILIEKVLGKTITDIRCKYGVVDGWLDTAECFIELDHKICIEIPYGQTNDVVLVEPHSEAKTIFDNLADIPEYHINKEGKTIVEVAEAHKKRKQNIFNRLRKALFNYEPPIKEYKPYRIEYHENKLKYIVNRKIVDYLWENDNSEKGYFELDNGFIISDQYMSPSGTGQAGLHYFDSLNSLKECRESNLKRHTEE